MKRLFFLSFWVLNFIYAHATNFYVSSSGNDLNNGTSASTPWRTLAKLNASFSAINAGDSVLFKRGEVFYGSLIVGKSGTVSARIIFSAYGSGAKPILSGFTSISSWTNAGGGIFSTTISSAPANLKVITINDSLLRVGRTPNLKAANGGYLSLESYVGTTSITDNELTSAINWTGADVVIRKNHYILDICDITNHSGGTITYTNPVGTDNTYAPKANYGYFIQNDLRTLDEPREYFLDPTTKLLSVYMGASALNARVSTVDTIVNFGGKNGQAIRSNLTIENISIEGGNEFGVFGWDGVNITVKNCDVKYCTDGIYLWNITNSLIDGNLVENSNNNGITARGRVSLPTVIRNNTIRNSGLVPGMSRSGDNQRTGIKQDGNNSTIEYNKVINSGYNGIHWQGSNVGVQYNYVDGFNFTVDDGGGIYTWQGPSSTYTNRVVKNNIILNAIGAPYGTSSMANDDSRHIYADDQSSNILIENNTCAFGNGAGIFLNSARDSRVSNNVVYKTNIGIEADRMPTGTLLRNMQISQNRIFPLVSNFFYWNGALNVPVVTDIQSDMRAIGTFDSNYYRNDLASPFDYYYHLTSGGTFVDPPANSMHGWKAYINSDFKSKKMAKDLVSYQVNAYLGGNKFLNGQFLSNINGLSFSSPTNNHTAAFDNTSKLMGSGSLKISSSTLTSDYTSISASVGAVTAGKKYLLKLSVLGSNYDGKLQIALRKTISPFTNITPVQTNYFGLNTAVYEFLLSPTSSDVDASFLIQIQQLSGTTYIDNIEFYEVLTTAIDPNSIVRFEYNATNTASTIMLGGNYMGVDSTVYNGKITLQPFTSAILFKMDARDEVLTADAGRDILVQLPIDSVSMAGVASTSNVTYLWTKVSGPSQYIIKNPTSAFALLDSLVSGVYIFKMQVTDLFGRTFVDSLTITVTGSILPVNLIDFNVTKPQNAVGYNINWSTNSESNVDYYEVERGVNGHDFSSINKQYASNILSRQNFYSFLDNPVSSTNYYRLKMVSGGGVVTYSKIVSVSFKAPQAIELNELFLNNAGVCKLNIYSDQPKIVDLVIYSTGGIKIAQKNISLQRGSNLINTNMQGIQTGVYVIQLLAPGIKIAKSTFAGN